MDTRTPVLNHRSAIQSDRRHGGRARVLAFLGAAVVATVMLVLPGTPAAAATVSGCAQGWSQYHGVCIWVETGTKDTSAHTQWVLSIKVQGMTTSTKLEAWAGDGPTGVAWYATTNGTVQTWTINKWIKTNSGICGSYTYPNTSDRSIACITIKV